VSSGDLEAFTFVLVVDSLTNWGAFEDAYEGSDAEKVDQDWDEVADCKSSSIWTSMKIE